MRAHVWISIRFNTFLYTLKVFEDQVKDCYFSTAHGGAGQAFHYCECDNMVLVNMKYFLDHISYSSSILLLLIIK